MRWLDGIPDSMDMSLSNLWELVMEGRPGVLQSMRSQSVKITERLNTAELKIGFSKKYRIPNSLQLLF